jgi:hypothetical protein
MKREADLTPGFGGSRSRHSVLVIALWLCYSIVKDIMMKPHARKRSYETGRERDSGARLALFITTRSCSHEN